MLGDEEGHPQETLWRRATDSALQSAIAKFGKAHPKQVETADVDGRIAEK
jgi:hypothetical protein